MMISLGDKDKYFHFLQHFGMAAFSLVYRDMYLLDNQIPLWVINLLIELICGEGSKLLFEYLSLTYFVNCSRVTRIPGDENQPLHLLDAAHRILVQEMDNVGNEHVQPVNRFQWRQRSKENPNEFGNTIVNLIRSLISKQKASISNLVHIV